MARQGKNYSQESVADIPAERVVLATVFHTKNVEMIHTLQEEDFLDSLNGLLLRAMKEMVKKDIPLEYVSLAEILRTPEYEKYRKHNEIYKEGAIADAITLVLEEFINPANLEYFFRKLRKERLRRGLLRCSDKLWERAVGREYDPLESAKWIITQVKRHIGKSKLEVEK